MECSISCSPPRLPTSHNPPYIPKPQSTVYRPVTMQQFSLSTIPRNVPFAVANGLTTYFVSLLGYHTSLNTPSTTLYLLI